MKKILVIYFSQTGQAKQALDATLKPFAENSNYQLDYHLIKPKKAFPYPWSYTQFFDVFPETVQGFPCEIEPLNIDTSINYDLVVIAYQPWFLSVCRPVNSFLLSADAKKLLNGKPVRRHRLQPMSSLKVSFQLFLKQDLKHRHRSIECLVNRA